MDVRELMGASAQLQQDDADMADPRQHLAWALMFFPSPNPQMGEVPIQPAVRPLLSQLLWDLGFRHNPELQTKWFTPGDHPEGGWLNVPNVVDRAGHAQWKAAHSDPEAEAEKWRGTAESLLGVLNPKLAGRIENMTPDERAAAQATYRQQMPAAFDRLAELKKQMEEGA
ncbi:hypothetical protein AB0H71_13660 [Nocardia sp. NPDC050697]|uniref:phage gene 29 protein family protein n=1 Tax=Nocardia sp. NPDC050697 TaxID=3155158 RepID=UPI0033EEAEE7